jgi:hypothetical protein
LGEASSSDHDDGIPPNLPQQPLSQAHEHNLLGRCNHQRKNEND